MTNKLVTGKTHLELGDQGPHIARGKENTIPTDRTNSIGRAPRKATFKVSLFNAGS